MSTSTIQSVLPILVITAICAVLFEWRRGFQFDFLSAFSASYVLLYVFVPIALLLSPGALTYALGTNWSEHFFLYERILPWAAVGVLLFYLSFLSGVALFGRIDVVPRFILRRAICVEPLRLHRSAIAFLSLGICFFFIYAASVGGPVSALIQAQLIRSGLVQEAGPAAFVKHFMRIAFFAAFIFLANKPPHGAFCRFRQFSWVSIALIASTMIAWLYASRALFLVLIGTMIITRYAVRPESATKAMIIRLVAFAAFALFVIAFMRPLLLLLAGREVDLTTASMFFELYSRLIQGLSSAFISYQVAISEVALSGVSAGQGLLLTIIDLIPKRLLGVDYLQTVNRANTEMFGFGTDERLYTITAGMLGYFIHEFHWFGTVLGGFITAIIVSPINRLYSTLRRAPAYGSSDVVFSN